MNNIKIGDELKIHCYKHNGKIHRAWDEATVLKIDDDKLICANFNTKVTESDGRSYKTKEPAVMIFYKNRWYNIIGQLKKQGLFYYCNIASPYIIDEGIIKYIDYDLDLRVFPDGGFKVLDQNEYTYHKELMNYSDELDNILRNELSDLIELKRRNKGPFLNNTITNYYNIYKEIKSQ